MRKKMILTLLLSGTFFLNLSAQNRFWIITPWQQEKFRIGAKVMFELKNHALLDSNSAWCINQTQGIYEMRITGLNGQTIIFNGKDSIHYSALKWIFIKTPGRTLKSIVAFNLVIGTIPLYYLDMGYGIAASILFIPISAILLTSSNKFYYSMSDEWYPAEKPGE